jgi:hypothetical protein
MMRKTFLGAFSAFSLILILSGCTSPKSYPSSKDPEVRMLIEKVNLPLPDSYIRFLENPKMFIPHSTTIDLCEIDKNYVGEWMCPYEIEIEAWDTPEKAIKTWGYTKGLFEPEELFTIAGVLGGEELLIGFGEKNRGEIWFWSGDFGYLKIAASLEEFPQLLR